MNVSASNIANSLGIGSGIDMTGLASQLRRRSLPAQCAADEIGTLERQISLAADPQLTEQFASALGDRLRTGDLAPTPSITNSAVEGLGPSAGRARAFTRRSHSDRQTRHDHPQLCQRDGSVGAGTMTIRFGATTNAGFTEDTARTPLELTFAPGATLSEVAGAINSRTPGFRPMSPR